MSTETKTKGTGKRTTTKELAQKQAIAKQMYLDGHRDLPALGNLIGVSQPTIYKWCNSGKWKEEVKEDLVLDMDIKRKAKQTLIAAMDAYIKEPGNKDLQSIVFQLKDFNKQMEPSKDLNNHIILFLDQQIQYCHEKGLEDMANMLQEQIHDEAEWLRVKNNG